MKKIIRLILFSFAFMFLFTFKVKADDDIIIKNWKVNCSVLQNGSLYIDEDITFGFDDDFNGVYRNISKKGMDNIKDIKISEKAYGKDKRFEKVLEGKKGQDGVYDINDSKDSLDIKIYSPSREDTQKTFNIRYTLKNVCTKYNDIGELFYNLVGKENKTKIDNFEANIKFPYAFDKDKVKIFAHGPLNGKIKFLNSDTVNLKAKDVSQNKFIAARILFPKEYIKDSYKVINKDAYKNIMNEELKYKKDTENKIKRNAKLKEISKYVSIVIIGIAVLLIIIIVLNLKTKKKFNAKYSIYPDECTPAVLSLVYGLNLTSSAIIATILDLDRKGYFKIKENDDLNYKNKKRKDKVYTIEKLKEADEVLLKHEKFFINWLINKVGNGFKVTTEEIKKYSKSNRTDFNHSYKKWKILIQQEVKNKRYFDLETKNKFKPVLFYSFLSVILTIVTLIFNPTYGVLAFFTSILLVIFSACIMYKKTYYGKDQMDKWKKFKKTIDKEEIVDIDKSYSIDKYLVYAIVLGLTSKTVKKLKKYMGLNGYNDKRYYGSYAYWYIHSYGSNNKNSFAKSIDSSFVSVTPSSGGGGGFSSGGAGSSGGGGAGGF